MANKATQIEKLKKQFFPDKRRLTKNQKAWLEEYRKAQNRVDDWAEKFRAVYELPQKAPKSIKKEDIENLKNVNWRKFTEEQKQKAREQFEIYYEGEVPEVYKKQSKYVPPTEAEWIEGYDPLDDMVERSEMYGDEKQDEEGYTPVVDSRAEIERWIDENINTITIDAYTASVINAPVRNLSNVSELPGVRDTLYMLVINAADAFGDYIAYYSYLEQNAESLHRYATEAMMGYFNKKTQSLEILYPNATQQFATILNLNRPLDKMQSDRLNDEGWVSYDFNE